MMLRHFNFALRCPAHEVGNELKKFMDNIQTYRSTYSDWSSEEVFIESTAYLTLLGAAKSNTLDGLVLGKGHGTEVGSMFGIRARSAVFTPVHNRDEEQVPMFTLQYRMFQ